MPQILRPGQRLRLRNIQPNLRPQSRRRLKRPLPPKPLQKGDLELCSIQGSLMPENVNLQYRPIRTRVRKGRAIPIVRNRSMPRVRFGFSLHPDVCRIHANRWHKSRLHKHIRRRCAKPRPNATRGRRSGMLANPVRPPQHRRRRFQIAALNRRTNARARYRCPIPNHKGNFQNLHRPIRHPLQVGQCAGMPMAKMPIRTAYDPAIPLARSKPRTERVPDKFLRRQCRKCLGKREHQTTRESRHAPQRLQPLRKRHQPGRTTLRRYHRKRMRIKGQNPRLRIPTLRQCDRFR